MPSQGQRKTKGQQLKGKVVSAFVTLFSPFFTLFIIFPPGLSPSKERVLAQGEQKRRKDNKMNRTNRCCTLAVARLSSSYKGSVGAGPTEAGQIWRPLVQLAANKTLEMYALHLPLEPEKVELGLNSGQVQAHIRSQNSMNQGLKRCGVLGKVPLNSMLYDSVLTRKASSLNLL